MIIIIITIEEVAFIVKFRINQHSSAAFLENCNTVLAGSVNLIAIDRWLYIKVQTAHVKSVATEAASSWLDNKLMGNLR